MPERHPPQGELRIRSFGGCGVGVRSFFLFMNEVDQFGVAQLLAEPSARDRLKMAQIAAVMG